MKNVTIFSGFNKVVGNKELQEFLREVKEGRFRPAVEEVRSLIREGREEEAQKLKKGLMAVTLCALYAGGRREANLTEYNGMVVLDVDDLSPEELTPLREVLEADSHTYACFVSPSGGGLKVLVNVNRKNGVLPTNTEDIKQFHRDAYSGVMAYYKELSGAAIDVSGKDVGRLCYTSYDPLLYLNEQAVAFIPREGTKKKGTGKGKKFMSPRRETSEKVFHSCVLSTSHKEVYQQGNRNVYLNLLANNCNRKGLDKEEVERRCLEKFVDMDTEEVRATIASAYAHTEEHGMADSDGEGNFDKIEQFLKEHYEIRYNEVSTRAEVRDKGARTEFENVTDRRENSIWRAVNKLGMKCTIGDIQRLLLSDLFPKFNPFITYFAQLPAWDGTDYIAQMAATVRTEDDAYWLFCFRKWLVAMAASLIYKETVNQVVLVFAGDQGIGKTRWTLRVLPPELKHYYATASIHEKDTDLLLKLSHRALVNIDEMDVLIPKDMAKFKKLITQMTIDERKAFGHNEESYERHASFVASTNNDKILSDPTGSRRFATFVMAEIDTAFSIDYTQLYAQVKQLLSEKFQYWFDLKEITLLNAHNAPHQSLLPEEEFLLSYFRKPRPTDSPLYLSASEILKRLSNKTGIQITSLGVVALGKILKKHNFKAKRLHCGIVYSIYEISLDEVERRNKLLEGRDQLPDNEKVIVSPELPF